MGGGGGVGDPGLYGGGSSGASSSGRISPGRISPGRGTTIPLGGLGGSSVWYVWS